MNDDDANAQSGESGWSSYSPLSTLERQYAGPLSRRVFLFCRTNANVCLEGGVETVLRTLKQQQQQQQSNGFLSSQKQQDGSVLENGTGEVSAEASAASPPVAAAPLDPFSFLTDASASDATVAAAAPKKKGGPNIGRFLKNVAKSTTQTIERGMTNLAIRADGGKSPDVFALGMYHNGKLLNLTENRILPMGEQRYNGLRFAVPLVVPTNLDDTDSVVLKLWIRSGATLAAVRPYLIGAASLTCRQLRLAVQDHVASFLTITLQSQIVADGKLLICLTPDLKLPPLCGRGWSLADPDVSAYNHSNPQFNWPLDQSYGMGVSMSQNPLVTQNQAATGGGPASPAGWLIVSERALESTVVLPIAAALARMSARAARVSLEHAQAVQQQVWFNRHDSPVKNKSVEVNLGIGFAKAPPDTFPVGTTGFVSVSWQRPDSIFEVDLVQPTRLPLQPPASGDFVATTSCIFHPKPVTSGILQGLKQQAAQQQRSGGFFLGTLRLQLTLSFPRGGAGQPADNPFVTAGSGTGSLFSEVETWEAHLSLESLWGGSDLRSQQDSRVLECPLWRSGAQQVMGSLVVSCQFTNNGSAQPSMDNTTITHSPQGGLISLMGLAPLPESISPHFDTVTPPVDAVSDTLGSFLTHGFIDNHIRVRTQDVAILEDRANAYQTAVAAPSPNTTNPETIHEERLPKAFRPSSSRPTTQLAGLPFNCHTASLSLNVVDPEHVAIEAQQQQHQTMGVCITNITHGAPADHARGFGNIFRKDDSLVGLNPPIGNGSVSGGLRRLEKDRNEIAKHVMNIKTALVHQVNQFFVHGNTGAQSGKPKTHIPSRSTELQTLRWQLFEALQSWYHVSWHCAVRRTAVFSQALGLAVTAYLASISDPLKWQSSWPAIWTHHGFLVSFEGLLSAAGKELGMIEDASVAVGMLRMVSVVFKPADSVQQQDPEITPVVSSPYLKWIKLTAQHSGSATPPNFTLEIGIVPFYFGQRIPPVLQGNPVRFYPLLFEVGVDIRQWGAHAGSSITNSLNRRTDSGEMKESEKPEVSVVDDDDDDGGEFRDDDVLVELNYEAYNKLNMYAHLISPATNVQAPAAQPGYPQSPKVHPLLETLYQHILSSSGKMNHEILNEAALLSQQLGGAGLVFCKSGKDRTAMHVTHKQSHMALSFQQKLGGLPSTNVPDLALNAQGEGLATTMRVYGTRLPICEKNVGQAKFAFNSLQVKFMPDALRPPLSTLAGFLKGGKVFTGGGIET